MSRGLLHHRWKLCIRHNMRRRKRSRRYLLSLFFTQRRQNRMSNPSHLQQVLKLCIIVIQLVLLFFLQFVLFNHCANCFLPPSHRVAFTRSLFLLTWLRKGFFQDRFELFLFFDYFGFFVDWVTSFSFVDGVGALARALPESRRLPFLLLSGEV